MAEHLYFLVGKDAPAMVHINACIEKHRIFCDGLNAFKEKYNAKAVMTMDNRRIIGLVFEGEVPAPWRGLQDWCVPDARTKAGKAIKREIEDLPKGLDGLGFSDMMGSEYTHMGGARLYWSTFSVYGDKIVLSVPAACNIFPQGCPEITPSQKWKIAEEYEAALAAKAAAAEQDKAA